jgi:phage shock protein PspC (stress-responsive transcriptional regulator)/predicted membrane protein
MDHDTTREELNDASESSPTNEDSSPHEPGSESATTASARSLRRSSTNKVISGVCGGIGERYAIDPNIVRAIFVLLAIPWGFAAALYILLWIFVPRSGAQARREPVEPTSMLGRHWLSASLIVGAVFLVVVVVSVVTSNHGFATGIGALWLIFLSVLAVVTVFRPSRRLTVRRVFATFFLVVISALILLCATVMTFLAASGVSLSGGIGASSWHPLQRGEIASAYRVEFGTATVDLTSLPATKGDINITASVGAGKLTIIVPENAVLNLKSHVGLGPVEMNFFQTNQHFASADHPLHLTINAQVGAGTIEIDRLGSIVPVFNGP